MVFIVGLEENVFPHVRSIGEPRELEEERRLAYVGITRARERLYLTNAWSRTLFGSTSYNLPSRFLKEVPEELVTVAPARAGPAPPGPARPAGATPARRSGPGGAASTPGRRRRCSAASRPRPSGWPGASGRPRPGSRPRRRGRPPPVGPGIVASVSGQGERAMAEVDFPGLGRKRLLLRTRPDPPLTPPGEVRRHAGHAVHRAAGLPAAAPAGPDGRGHHARAGRGGGRGAVGMVPAQMLPADELAALLEDLAGRTDGVVGVTFLLPFGADPACVEVAAARARWSTSTTATLTRPWWPGSTTARRWPPGRPARSPRPGRRWTPAATWSPCRGWRRRAHPGPGRAAAAAGRGPGRGRGPGGRRRGIAGARGVAACLAAGVRGPRSGPGCWPPRSPAPTQPTSPPCWRPGPRTPCSPTPSPSCGLGPGPPHPRLRPGRRRVVRGRGRRRDPHGRDHLPVPASASPAPTARPPARSPPWSTAARASAPPTGSSAAGLTGLAEARTPRCRWG